MKLRRAATLALLLAVAPPLRPGVAAALADSASVVPAWIDGGRIAPALRTSSSDGTWQAFFASPIARMTQSTIYDPVRKRMIVFGGQTSAAYLNDTWALSLTGTPAWMPLSTSGTSPAARIGHSAIYDPVRDRMVVFGGYDGTNRYHDVWALALTNLTWTNITPPGGVLSGPTPRYYHAAIYDPVRDRMLVLGGYDSFDEGDVWALTFSTNTWTQLAPAGSGPVGLENHTSIYDPVRDRMLTFGGFDGTHRSDTTWVLTLAATPTWSRLSPSGTPPLGLTGSRGAYDSVRDRFVISGGYDGSYENAVWAITLAGSPAWSQLTPGGTPPVGSADQSVIYDPTGDRLVTFDGTDGPNGLIFHVLDQTFSLSLAGSPAWTKWSPSPDAPPARINSTAVYDLVGSRLLVYGGEDPTGSPLFGDTRAYSFAGSPGWSNLAPTGTPPPAREGHTAIYDPQRNRMIIFGGAGGSAALNDVWTLSLGASPAWTPLTPTGTPPSGRYFASAVYDAKRDRMLVFAGRFSFNYSNEVWALTLSGTPAWTLLTPSGTPPSARASQVAIYDPIRDRMLMYGGSNSSGPLTDLWALNLASGPAWNALTTAGSQGETGGYSAIYDLARDRVLLFGGYDAFGNDYNYVAALSLTGTPTWTSLSPLGVPPSPRANSPTVYDKNVDRMIVFGGASGDVWSLTWGTPLSVPDPDATVERFALAALSPNPFRGRVAIAFDVPRASWLQLRVFDLQGREVKRIADAQFAPGRYAREWDGRNESGALEPAGIYFIGLSSRGVSVTRKAVLIR